MIPIAIRASSLLFQSTRPTRGGTIGTAPSATLLIFQSTRPTRGGTSVQASDNMAKIISIHPPHTGRDPWVAHLPFRGEYFNPPAPHGAGLHCRKQRGGLRPFQSTRPTRGGTHFADYWSAQFIISIHPPHTGRDSATHVQSLTHLGFQSTRPTRGGTKGKVLDKFQRIFQSTRPTRGGTGR